MACLLDPLRSFRVVVTADHVSILGDFGRIGRHSNEDPSIIGERGDLESKTNIY